MIEALKDTRCESEDYRLIEINHGMKLARYLAIQFKDFSVLDYRRDWEKAYAPLLEDECWGDVTLTGLRFGRWRGQA
jgi:hypothetical protein